MSQDLSHIPFNQHSPCCCSSRAHTLLIVLIGPCLTTEGQPTDPADTLRDASSRASIVSRTVVRCRPMSKVIRRAHGNPEVRPWNRDRAFHHQRNAFLRHPVDDAPVSRGTSYGVHWRGDDRLCGLRQGSRLNLHRHTTGSRTRMAPDARRSISPRCRMIARPPSPPRHTQHKATRPHTLSARASGV